MANDLVAQDLTTTSRIVAEKFGKRHDDVLKAIRNLGCSEEFMLRNFAEHSYLDGRGNTQPMYRITRDGFMLLGMGFNTAQAMQWKELFIKAFNEAERQLTEPPMGMGLLKELVKAQELERQNRLEQHEKISEHVFSLDERVTRLEKRKRIHIAPSVKKTHLRCLRWLSWRCPLTGEPIPHTDDGEPLLGSVEFDHFYTNQLPNIYHTWPLSKNGHAVLTRGKMLREEIHRDFMAYQRALEKMLSLEPQQLDIWKAFNNG